MKNNKDKIFLVGFSPWKTFMKNWLTSKELIFIKKWIPKFYFHLRYAPLILKKKTKVYFWGYKAPKYVKSFTKKHKIPVCYVEDGFIRSLGLGSQKNPPISLCIDSKAPYFDASKRTDLEDILNFYDFKIDKKLMLRAKKTMESLINLKVSKYNFCKTKDLKLVYGSKNRKRVLVIGQVESDDSIKYGCDKEINNIDLIKIAIKENPSAQIIYKPHPEILMGKRKLGSSLDQFKKNCLILEDTFNLSDCFWDVDHVYTITSLVGFEALIRGIKVTTLGCPFYAGWGCTDTRQVCERRNRKLSVYEIFAASYILYPQYRNNYNGKEITVEESIREIMRQSVE